MGLNQWFKADDDNGNEEEEEDSNDINAQLTIEEV